MKKQFAVILAGCGSQDGSEIHEATMTLLAIDLAGAQYSIFAPDKNQHHVINHINGKEIDQERNVLVESARIARGKIDSLDKLDASKYDALIIPGGYGAAKNLCDYAFKGPLMEVDTLVAEKITDFKNSKKPIGALCIAPMIISKLFPGSHVTLGQNNESVTHAEMLGAVHENTNNGEVIHDTENNIFTNPCYMLKASIGDIYRGAQNVVNKIMETL
ncbi:MAG: isoprenoid biosynthesis glyoxalase ElbB [Bacteroidales bacterium]|nr:isoprenoid biosynthesis glyoxalase ElbB [Bacteroidales bacterium]